MNTFAHQDKQEVEASNVMTMQGEKLLPSGRPMFKLVRERFMWDLEHDTVDETTKALAKVNKTLWESAEQEFRKKIG
jgi:hypothetical protein